MLTGFQSLLFWDALIMRVCRSIIWLSTYFLCCSRFLPNGWMIVPNHFVAQFSFSHCLSSILLFTFYTKNRIKKNYNIYITHIIHLWSDFQCWQMEITNEKKAQHGNLLFSGWFFSFGLHKRNLRLRSFYWPTLIVNNNNGT